jgi:Tol biopolymer transport system component
VTLASGCRLGPYEILAPLGAGGMGEVYRARDERLKREVAIKVLPVSFSTDPDRLRRFEQEAQAAGGLNHPNITAVYDLGSHEGAPYVVQELLEGETLRMELAGGRFSPRKAIDYALQITQGLAAAHDKGIVHRDLKPENLFVTKEGRVKILDFGLAKLTEVGQSGGATNLPTVTPGTEPGVVMGTLGYMSPEQVKGKPADARSDIFSFGAIFYEMLSGKRAFHADSAGETMAAILREEPPDLSVTNENISPGLERILRHCLEKNPERRFQSASDIAFALEALSGLPTASGTARAAATSRPLWTRPAAAAAAMLALLGAGLLAGSWFAGGQARSFPTYKRLTFRRGFISNARFAPDGQTILYSADWDGAPSRIFSTRPGGRESTALPLPSAMLLDVSSRGEMAILLDPRVDYNLYVRRGTLAVVPLSGGSPRELLREVRSADWSPDGKDLAVVRLVGARQRLEYPPGRLAYESSAWILLPRVSPRGNRIAFFEGLPFNGFALSVIDSQNRKTVLGPLLADWWNAPWSPDGQEIWFTASTPGSEEVPILATDLSGRRRLLERGQSNADLTDVSRDGRALIVLVDQQEWTRGLLSGQKAESRLVSRTDLRMVDLSEDGKVLVLREAHLEGTPNVWIARADDSPPIRLGEGVAHGLSPDGAWVLASQQGMLLALPTAAGAPRPMSEGFFEAIRWASWFRDGKRVLVWGQAKGGKTGIFVVEGEGHEPRRIAPEGYELVSAGNALSPDGRLVVARSPENQIVLCPVDGGQPRPIPGLAGFYEPVQWSADGKGFYVFRMGEIPARVEKIDVESGRATLWKELAPPDIAGMVVRAVAMTPDGTSYAYSCQQYLTTLYLVENLESWRRPTFWSRLLGRSP